MSAPRQARDHFATQLASASSHENIRHARPFLPFAL